MRAANASLGFSLLELLVALAVMACLATLAMPSYQDAMHRSHRLQAQTQLARASLYLQQFYAQNDRFDQDVMGQPVRLPDALLHVPIDAPVGAEVYVIDFVQPPTAQAFSLAATPRPGGPMGRDACGALQIDHLGRHTPSVSVTEACWR